MRYAIAIVILILLIIVPGWAQVGTDLGATPQVTAPNPDPFPTVRKSYPVKRDYVSRDDLERHVSRSSSATTVVVERVTYLPRPEASHNPIYREMKKWNAASESYVNATTDKKINAALQKEGNIRKAADEKLGGRITEETKFRIQEDAKLKDRTNGLGILGLLAFIALLIPGIIFCVRRNK